MTSYNEASLVHKLAKLVDTQDSITVLSQWLMYHRKHAALSVQTWARELHKATPARKLSFLYLANDVVQNSRRKGDEFVKEFAKVFPETLPHVFRHTPADTQQKISRILGILEERRIYSPEFVKAIKDKLVNRPGTPAANHITGDAAGIARHLDNIKRLDASKAKFSSVLTVEPGAGAEDHSETLANLEQYRQALTADIAERTALIRELKALEERMSLFVKGDQLALEQCNQRIESISPGGLHNNVPQTPSPLSPADSLTLTTPDASATPPLPTDSNSTDNIENSMSPAPPQQDDEEYDPEAAHEAIPSATPPIQTLQPGNTLLPQDLLATLFQQTAGGTGPPIDPDLLRTLNAFLPQQSPSSAVPPQTE